MKALCWPIALSFVCEYADRSIAALGTLREASERASGTGKTVGSQAGGEHRVSAVPANPMAFIMLIDPLLITNEAYPRAAESPTAFASCFSFSAHRRPAIWGAP